jgi:hypothetical protein
VFSVQQRDALYERVLSLGRDDQRVVAGALVGSLASGGGDRFSDLDLTFALAPGAALPQLLDDWTAALGGVVLVDLVSGPTTFRVLLFDDALQLDLSFTPADRFAPAGPKWRLLFGEIAPDAARTPAPPDAGDLFGWGVIYALHARTCIERGRPWAAEHYIGAVRDRALSIACLRHGLIAVQARGYDDLPSEVLTRFEATHVASLEPATLRAALSATMRALLHEAEAAGVPNVEAVGVRLGVRRGRGPRRR